MSIGYVAQGSIAFANESSTSSFTPTNAGDLIVISFRIFSGSGASYTVADSNGTVYVANAQNGVGGTNYIYQLYIPNCAAGQHNLTFSAGASFGGAYGSWIEFSGVATSNPLDQVNNNGAGSALYPGTVNPMQNNELLVTAISNNTANNVTYTIDSGFSLVNADATVHNTWQAYLIQTTATSEDPAWGGTGPSGSCRIATFFAQTYSISGNAGVAGATVSYTGTASGSVTADGSGNYSINGLASGSYTITPSLTGYTFSPTSASETVSSSNITGVNFTASATTHSISGNAGVAGATVSYSGTASGSVTADGSGNYTISGLANGPYTITPSLTGYTFSPTSASETVSGSNITGVNFTATPVYSISGNAGIAGATVSYSGTSSGSVTADGSGNYTISGLANGSYTITPSLTGYSFSPSSSPETVSGSNITGVNFTATPVYSISGNAGAAVATVSYTGTASGSVTADGSGNYSITGLSNGSYTITPTKTGYTFSPSSSPETVSGSNITGVNFTATAPPSTGNGSFGFGFKLGF